MRLRLAAIIAVTLVCLGWVVSAIEEQARTALTQTAWWTFGPMFLCYIGAHAFRTLWLGTLLGADIPFSPLFAINSIGFLAINVIPLRLGEFVRPAMLKDRHDVLGQALAAIVMERLLDMAMLFIKAVGLTFVVQLPTEGLMVSGVDVVGAGRHRRPGPPSSWPSWVDCSSKSVSRPLRCSSASRSWGVSPASRDGF